MKRAAGIVIKFPGAMPRANEMTPTKNYRAEVSALIAYILLAVILTYPLILNFATHVPGDGNDDPALTWNLWWIPHGIIDLGINPVYTNYIFYPIGVNLAFYTLTPLNALLSIPLQSAFNLIVAANVYVLLSFALSGFGAYLLASYLFRVRRSTNQMDKVETLAAFAAGGVYAFSSDKFLYAWLGQYDIISSQWFPFYILFLLKLTNNARPKDARTLLGYGLMLGLFLLFATHSELIFGSFLVIFTALYLIYWMIAHRFRPPWFILRLASLVVTALVFILPSLPILVAMIQDTIIEGDFILSGVGFADVFSSDALGFFVPSQLHPIWGNLQTQFHFTYINFVYLGFAVLVLSIIALLFVPRARIWGWWGLIFITLALGPDIVINGTRYDTPMPFDILSQIPIIKGNRYPSRWSVMVTLAFAMLVGYGMAWLLNQISRITQPASRYIVLRVAYAIALVVLLFEHWSFPLPLSNLTVPVVYQTIARDKGDFTVLEIPLAWRNSFRMTGTHDQAMMFAQFYQTAHRRPILGGNTSRNPDFKFQYFTEAPVINSIIAVETGHKLDDATIARDKQLAPDVLRFFGIRYAVWHSPRNPENRAKLDAARAYVQFVLPVTQISEVSDDTGETIVFRVNDLPPLNQTTIRPNDSLARLNFAEGWGVLGGNQVWATRREAKLFVRIDSPRDATLALRAFAPMAKQQLVLRVNERDVCAITLSQGISESGCSVKRDAWRAGMNEIVWRFDLLAPVASVRQVDFAIGNTGATSPASIVAYSAGSEVGDFARIFVNGIDAAKNSRGYNIVVIDEKNGAIESSAAFDTFASVEESAGLAQFIDKIPNGRIVVVAARDEASRNLTPEAVDALRSIGAQVDLRNKWRWSHAIIGVKGSANGTANELTNEIAPAQLGVGVGAMEPNVAAAIEWLKVEPQ